LISNWMGSPEFRVPSSPEQEVSQKILPQEGHSVLLSVPYENLEPGTFSPGETVRDNPHLTYALKQFEGAMYQYSCTLTGNPMWRPCRVTTLRDGSIQYSNHFTSLAMPDPEALLTVEPAQHNMLRLILSFRADDPEDPGRLLVSFNRVAYRHADSYYEGH
jgi:hypothetical protein